MSFWTGLENGIEKFVRSTFTAGSRKRVEAVEIASALRRELDQESYSIPAGRTLAPNVFTVEFSDEDYPRAQEWGHQLAEELCDVVIRHARSQAYTLQGAVRVSFTRNPELETGTFEIVSDSERTDTPRAPSHATTSAKLPRPPAPAKHSESSHNLPTQPIKAAPQRVAVIEVAGERFSLNAARVSVGRSEQADITVDDTGVSRKHLEIVSHGHEYTAVDLGSTNGSYVDGEPLQGTAPLMDGSVITMGRTRLTFRLLAPKEAR